MQTLKQEYSSPAPPCSIKKAGRLDNDVSFVGVSKRFRRGSEILLALKNINLHVNPGEFVCIIGPSGCGKSTLLNMLAGLIEPSQGEVLIAGSRIEHPNV